MKFMGMARRDAAAFLFMHQRPSANDGPDPAYGEATWEFDQTPSYDKP